VCATTVTVTDICDDSPTFVLYDIYSDEPDNGLGDGNTTEDIQGGDLGTDDICFDLRSERQGGGDGRKYTIVYRASDHSGNTADDTVCVRVPHDQSSGGLASIGFSPDGTSLAQTADRAAVILPSSSGLNATAVDVSQIYLGNTNGVARPADTRVVDANKDGLPDLAMFFQAADISQLLAGGEAPAEDGALEAINGSQVGGYIGIHFVSPAGVDYLIQSIFALGAPVTMPVFTTEPPTPFDEGAPTVGALRETGLSSIHPNPFNPQTTVEFALASAQHVRILIYDVRGSLVRRLVDQSMGAGEQRAVWDGADDAGRQATSGIYFVRMTAGTHVQTRKIVMLK
jgi:hypothetical protein